MQLLGHFIVRLVVILFGILVAMLAAGMFLSFGLFAGVFTDFFSELQLFLSEEFVHNPNHAPYGEPVDTSPIVTLLVVVIGFFTSFHVMSLATLPTTIAIAIAELMRWHSLTVNLVLGGMVALFTGVSLHGSTRDGLPSEGTLVVLLATGFIAGFFYWMIAGRSAGKWLGSPKAD